MDTQNGGAKPSKPLGIIVAVVMLSYAFYALYTVIRVKMNYKKEAVGIVKNIEASFVPGNKVYVSQFSNIVTYEFFAGDAHGGASVAGAKEGREATDAHGGASVAGAKEGREATDAHGGASVAGARDGREATDARDGVKKDGGGPAPKIYSARVDSIMMSTKKAGDEITVYYDETAPGKFNIPALALWGDIMLFVVLSSIGSTLMWYMLKM